jgi:hypothetical protein
MEMVSFTFRVIDAHRRRVREAPAGGRYIAQSYVWGETNQFKTRKVDFREVDGGWRLADSHDDVLSLFEMP